MNTISIDKQLSSEQREKFRRAKTTEEIIRAANMPSEVFVYMMEGHAFKNVDEANSFLKQIQEKWNATPRRELLEHAPSEIAWLTYELPQQTGMLWKIDLSSFADEIARSPFFSNWINLLRYIDSNEVGATVQGNLNRKAIHDLLNTLDIGDMDELHRSWIRNEFDWEELSVLRACAEFAGLIKRRKRVWSITKRGSAFLSDGNTAKQYLQLFDTWFNKFDWGSLYRNERLENAGFQGRRFVVLSGLMRCAVEWTDYNAFLRVLCEFLRVGGGDDKSSLCYLFHYPLFAYLEEMNLLEIRRRYEGARSYGVLDAMRITSLGKHFIASLLD